MLIMWLFWEVRKDPKIKKVQSKNFKSQIKSYFSGSSKGLLHYHSEYHIFYGPGWSQCCQQNLLGNVLHLLSTELLECQSAILNFRKKC